MMIHRLASVRAFLLGLSLVAGSVQASEPYAILSDIDDTVKLTNVENKFKTGVNGIWGRKTFLGMAELYQEMAVAGLPEGAKPSQARVTFISGSPQVLRDRLRKMIVERNGFPESTFILRSWIHDGDLKEFKIREMTRLAATEPRDFVLVGDDTEYDPELFTGFAASQPQGKVAAVYIRRNNHRDIPAGATPFFSAFDMGLAEVEAGRLGPEAVTRVGKAMLEKISKDEDALDLMFPGFSYCPEEEYRHIPAGPVASGDPELMRVKARMERLIPSFCAVRLPEDR